MTYLKSIAFGAILILIPVWILNNCTSSSIKQGIVSEIPSGTLSQLEKDKNSPGSDAFKATFFYLYSPIATTESQKHIMFLSLSKLVQ
jgi:hypothetical protein